MKKNNSNASCPENNGSNARSQKAKKKNSVIKYTFLSVLLALTAGTIVGLSVALAYSQDKIEYQANYRRGMEAEYSRSYYNLIDGANDIDVKLRKVSAASTPEKQQSLLYEIWGSASMAEANLACFENNGEGVLKAQKFLNQLSDYSHALALKIADGETLTPEDANTLSKLGDVAGVLKKSLLNVQQSLDEGKLFMDDNGALSGFTDAFNDFADPSMEYPEMIYDGPFSDALEHRELKGLKGAEISEDEAYGKVKSYFAEYDIKDVSFAGETAGDIATYNFNVTVSGKPGFAQIAKKGGMLISYNAGGYSDEAQADANEPQCHALALDFAKSLGYKDMQAVWSSSANGMCIVNLAPVEKGAIIYPDLVKVKLDENSGDIIGFDAMHYAFNHTERDQPEPKLTEADARAKIKINAVGQGRLALIPLQETNEVLTYEFECENNGTYFVYIDAATGKEVNILYVIDTDQGTQLQ